MGQGALFSKFFTKTNIADLFLPALQKFHNFLYLMTRCASELLGRREFCLLRRSLKLALCLRTLFQRITFPVQFSLSGTALFSQFCQVGFTHMLAG